MRLIYSVCTFLSVVFFSSRLFSQEIVSPIGIRHELNQTTMSIKSVTNIDSLFIYTLDTLFLPIIDDFAKNHFQDYHAQPGDPNVSSEQFFALLDLSNQPLSAESIFTTIQTYRLNVTLQPNLILDTLWFPLTTLQYNNLQNYPVSYANEDVYPRYILIDTIDLQKPAPDTLWINTNLRKQDSATVFTAQINDSNAFWVDHNAHWNYTRAQLPRSLGVATFDGLDENGWPYAINTSTTGYGDFLTSKPLVLNFPPTAGVYLSFLYQAQGFGDVPESNDSLVVDFFNVLDQKWETVWGVSGAPVQPFKSVHLPITDTKYLQNGFKFRFKNYGGLSGDLDNWHIDFVRLQTNQTESDTILLDFAGVYPITSLLDSYTAIPWKHYRNNPTGHMSENLSVTLSNNNIIAGNTQNGVLRVFDENVLDHEYTFPGATLTTDLNYNPGTNYTTTHNLYALASNYDLPATSSNDTSYCFDFYFRAITQFGQSIDYQFNDTLKGKQCFENFYSYDDGSAEQAYGINGEQARLAYEFNALENDSLIAIQMHFVPTVFDHSNKLFLLTVWADNNGQPGQVLYQDDFFSAQSPNYADEKNVFRNYYFKDTIKIGVSGKFYVGWRQIDPERLNIGFDKNTNSQDKIFFSTDLGATWQNGSFPGSLMMRPVFSSKMDYQLGINEVQPEPITLEVYPNPADDILNLSFVKEGFIQFYRNDGTLVKTEVWDYKININDLNPGFYLVRVYTSNGDYQQTLKIIKK